MNCRVYGYGTVFKLTPNPSGDWTETILYDFTGGDNGGHPYAGVILDAQGNLYGTTGLGGKDNVGVVFELKPSKGFWNITVLHSFTGGHDGGNPGYGSLAMDSTGNLYGTTAYGGLYEYGTVFELAFSSTTGTWKETVLHSFSGGPDGGYPWSGLIFDAVGNLYGTAQFGGDLSLCNGYGCSVVFEVSP